MLIILVLRLILVIWDSKCDISMPNEAFTGELVDLHHTDK